MTKYTKGPWHLFTHKQSGTIAVLGPNNDAVADIFEQLTKGKWVDDSGHPVNMNAQMLALQKPVINAIALRKKIQTET